MPKKAKTKKRADKKSGKAAAKKAGKKKISAKKTAKKVTAKKIKISKKKAVRKPAARPTAMMEVKEKPMVAPGPQPTGIPPVEEPSTKEEAVGTVTHYYSNLQVAVVQVNKGSIKIGDKIHIKGHTTDFTQTVESMEYEHQRIDEAKAGLSVGIKVTDHAREHDIVYLVK